MGFIIYFFLTVTEYNKSSLAFFPGMGSGTSHKSGMQGFGYSPVKQGTGESEKPAHTHTVHTQHRNPNQGRILYTFL